MSRLYKVKVDGNIYEVEVELLSESSEPTIQSNPTNHNPPPQVQEPIKKTGTGIPIIAPMQGNIWKILKKVGDSVKAGDPILVLEAMKMENNIVAPKDGVIVSLLVKEGEAVESGATLAELA